MSSVSALDPTQPNDPGVFSGREGCERLRSLNMSDEVGAFPMPRKTASGSRDRDPVTPNSLQRLIRERMREMSWTYEDVEKRGGPSHSTLYSIATRREFRAPLRHATLQKLARGLDLPMDVLRVANGQALNYELDSVPITLENARAMRMIAATFEKLDPSRQKTAERIMRALLDEMKSDAAGAG